MSIFLIGYRGSGKTSVGKRLAQQLSNDFLDTDDLVVRRAGGRTIKQIFQDEGEAGFRELESQAVRDVSRLDDHVISLGGGAVLRENNQRHLLAGGGKIFYLRCDATELLRRITGDAQSTETRPALTHLGGGVEEIRTLLERREPIYRRLMSAEVDVTHASVEQVVSSILKLL